MGQGYAAFGDAGGPRQQQQHTNTTYNNPNVDPVIKAMCNQVGQLDPNITMASLLRNLAVRLNQVVLVDGNCVDFHVCRRGWACRFQHDATARLSADQVNNFMNLVKPVAEGLGTRCLPKQGRGAG
jgi:hypothetical protein